MVPSELAPISAALKDIGTRIEVATIAKTAVTAAPIVNSVLVGLDRLTALALIAFE